MLMYFMLYIISKQRLN